MKYFQDTFEAWNTLATAIKKLQDKMYSIGYQELTDIVPFK